MILIEIFFAVLEFFFEVFLEVLAGFAWEFGFNWFFKSLSELFDRFEEAYPWFALLLFALAGAGFGALSIFFLPHHLLPRTRFHGINLLLSPVAAGFFLGLLGRVAEKHGQSGRYAKFQYGFCFALGMALTRFLFAD